MTDYIERQAAIDAIDQYGSVWMEYTDRMNIEEIAERALKASKQSMIKILRDLPSAETENIHCKDCIHYDTHNHRCRYWNHGVKVDGYCSKADMRGEEE